MNQTTDNFLKPVGRGKKRSTTERKTLDPNMYWTNDQHAIDPSSRGDTSSFDSNMKLIQEQIKKNRHLADKLSPIPKYKELLRKHRAKSTQRRKFSLINGLATPSKNRVVVTRHVEGMQLVNNTDQRLQYSMAEHTYPVNQLPGHFHNQPIQQLNQQPRQSCYQQNHQQDLPLD